MQANIKKKKGFTLVEIIMSIALLSIISVVILNLFIVSSNLNKAASEKGLATTVAANDIENYTHYKTNQKIFYDDFWQVIKAPEDATYYTLITIDKDKVYNTLYYITSSVYRIDDTLLVSLKSARYNSNYEVSYE